MSKILIVMAMFISFFTMNSFAQNLLLTGVVNNGQQVALAGAVARSVKGARRVRNHIVVR